MTSAVATDATASTATAMIATMATPAPTLTLLAPSCFLLIRKHHRNIEIFEQATSTIHISTGINSLDEIVKIFS